MKREQVSCLQHLSYGQHCVPTRSDFVNAWKSVKALAAGSELLTDGRKLRLVERMYAAGTPADVIDEVLFWNELTATPESMLCKDGEHAGMALGHGAWAVYEALSVLMADGDLSADEIEPIRAVAHRVGVHVSTFDALLQLCHDESVLRRQRIDMLTAHGDWGIHVDQL